MQGIGDVNQRAVQGSQTRQNVPLPPGLGPLSLRDIEGRLSEALDRQRAQVDAVQSALYSLTGATNLPPAAEGKQVAPDGMLIRMDRDMQALASLQGDMATLINAMQNAFSQGGQYDTPRQA